ncbi:hypothetical protein ACFV1L_17010 [Kitasatospora sp. NPDC059646]|uniref:hypothetical protein n=1 Tax=Kitasatospora sp. NPDC059646 TaxID=3346893 RepID=UPI00367568BD
MPQLHTPPRWPLLALRTAAALVALLALLLPILAGGFLQGYYPLLDAHMQAGLTIAVVALLATAAALVARKVSGVPGRHAIQYGVLSALCIIQLTLGFQRVLLLHVPLGVGIFVMAEKLAVDAFFAAKPTQPAAKSDASEPDAAEPASAVAE